MSGLKQAVKEGTAQDVRFSRFSGIVNPEEIVKTRVNLIGCGGIGAWTALGLACLGVKLRIFDHDTTERHNFGGQPLPTIGEAKVTQIAKYADPLAAEIVAVQEKFSLALARKYPADIWISGVDSIAARQVIWDALKEVTDPPEWYVDGRMGGVTSHVIAVHTKDELARVKYEKTLKPAQGFTTDPCAMRSTVFAGMGCASRIVGVVAQILRGEQKPEQRNDDWLYGLTIVGWTQ